MTPPIFRPGIVLRKVVPEFTVESPYSSTYANISGLVREILLQPPPVLQAWPKTMGPIFRPGMSMRRLPQPFGVQTAVFSSTSSTLEYFVIM